MKNILSGIIRFAEKIEGFKLRPYQKSTIEEITRRLLLGHGGTLTSLWSRKSGKSETIKACILTLMSILPEAGKEEELVLKFPNLKVFRNGFNVAIAGPKMETAAVTFKRIRREGKKKRLINILSELGLQVITTNSIFFELSNGSLAQAFSGSETASSEGPDAHLLYLDEAQSLSAFSSYKILRPMVAASNGLIVETGTPGRKKCPYLSDIEYNMRYDKGAHSIVPYQVAQKYSSSYKKFIAGEKRRLPGGEMNPFFRMNYLLEWILAQGKFVEPEDFLKLATAQRGQEHDVMFGGIDWGKAGSNTVAVILGRKGEIVSLVDLLVLDDRSYDAQFERLIPFLRRYFNKKMLKVASETNAAGAPNTERLQREFGKGKIVEYYTTANWKDRIFTRLLTEIEGGRFRYFQDDSPEAILFEKEFLDAEQEVKGNLLSVHKNDDEGATDDCLIATANANNLFPQRYGIEASVIWQSTGKKRVSIEKTSDY